MRLLFTFFLLAFGCLFLVPSAQAVGTPDLHGGASSSNPLYGQQATVNLNANLGSGEVPGYNLSFRVVLPAGISYGGSASPAVDPTIIHNAPDPGQTTLLFSNVSDLVANSSQGLSFKVSHDTALYNVGDTYTIDTQSFVNSDPRYIPKFDTNGVAVNGPTSYTGINDASTTSTISAIRLTKSEGSPEGEILRGVHDHQVVYTLNVENNAINPTTHVGLDDWIPAGMEYLGCGGPDNTTDAPTNPGSPDEYAGSGLINVPGLAGCVAPDSVDTVHTDPDGAGPLPDAVYTHVHWNVGTLAAHQTLQFKYQAAVPLRENTMTWTGTQPSAASGQQGTNLDNNSGAETKDEQAITNYALVGGDYNDTKPVTSDDHITRSAEDLLVRKSVNSSSLSQGAISTWDLTFQTSEYRYSENIEVTDTLPSGYCPLGPVNYTTQNDPSDSECDPTGDNPSAPYKQVTENPDGSFTITWDSSVLATLGHTNVNDTFHITFPSKTRNKYQDNFLPTTPILARDALSNDVDLTGETSVRCTAPGTPDCSTAGPTISHDGTDPVDVVDSSTVGQTASAPTIDKKVATSGIDCLTATYTNNTVPAYYPGDRVCWQLNVDFPSAVDTDTNPVMDFLPVNSTFETGSEQATAADTVSSVFDPSDAFTHNILSWTINSGLVPTGAKKFQHVFSTIVTPQPGIMQDADLKGNLMKFASTNTDNAAVPLRDQQDILVNVPAVSLTKGVKQVNSGPVNGPNTDHVQVHGGDTVTYRVDVTGGGTGDSSDIQVWDILPLAYDCTLGITSISNSGTCVDGGLGPDRIEWTLPSLANATTTTLTYDALVPTDSSPSETLVNHAGVRQYQTPTNLGGEFTYTPENNIDPLNPDPANVPVADDASDVYLADAAVTKTRTTDVVEPGNTISQATIGETVTYTVDATIPYGTTVAGSPTLTDTPDSNTRQPYVVGSATATLNGAPLPVGWTLDTSGAVPKILFPASYTNSSTTTDDHVVLSFDTKVADIVGNTRLSGDLTNVAQLQWTSPAIGAQTRTSNTINTPIVEPLLTQTKIDNINPGRAQPGQVVQYTLTTKNSNASQVSVAHQTIIQDTLPVGITPVGPSPTNTPLSDGDTVPGTGGAVWDSSARTITNTVATMDPNATVTWTYRTTVDNPATAGNSFTNNAQATTTSLGGTTGERTSSSTNHVGYFPTSTDTVRVAGASVSKSADRATATIGDKIVYTADVLIPAGLQLYDTTVTDTLPDSIDFDSYTSATCVSGCPADPAPTVQTYTAVVGASTTTIAWDFGDIAPGSGDRVVRLVYTGHVRNTHRGGVTLVTKGQTSINSITVESNLTNKNGPFNPAVIPPAGGFDTISAPATFTTTIIEPTITVDKKVKVASGSFVNGPANAVAGQSFTYSIDVKNTGNSDAYDVQVTDKPDNELTNVVLVTGASYSTQAWTAGDHNMKWTIPGPIAPGATVTLTYTADPISVASLSNNQTAVNTAAIPHYFGVDQATRTANPTITYRDYTNGGSDSVTVTFRFPILQMTKTTGGPGFPDSATAEVGQPFPWRVTLKNNATTAQAVTPKIVDTLPANWTYVPGSATLAPGGAVEPTIVNNPGGDTLTWNVATLNAGASVVVTFQAKPTLAAKTNPGLGANINSATGTATDQGGNSGNASGAYTATDTATGNLVAPDLHISKTPDAGTATPGQNSPWTVDITNTGAGTARNLVVTDVLPAGMTYTPGSATAVPSTGFSEASVTPGPGIGQTTIVWHILSLAPTTGHVVITVPAVPSANLLNGTLLTNTAAVAADEAPTPVNDTGTMTTLAKADLVASKSSTPAHPVPGQNFTYHITATNNGPSDAQTVQITDTLPAQVSFVSADPGCNELAGTVTCLGGTLAPGDHVTYDIVVHLAADASSVSNTIHTSSPTDDPFPLNNTATYTFTSDPQADLAISKTANPTTINHTQNTTFTLTVTNPTGPSTGRGLTVTDTLPSGLTFVSASPVGANCTAASQVITCHPADIAVGGSIPITIVATGNAVGTWTNNVQLASTSTDTDPDNNHASADVQVDPVADMEIVKSGPATANADSNITYTLTATNNGPDTAHHAVVTDTLPAGVSYVSDDAGCSETSGTLTCDLGTMTNGQSKTIHVVAHVPTNAAQTTITNNANVAADETDLTPGNNHDSANTDIDPAVNLSITKTANPATVNNGENTVFTIHVHNSGPSTATHVVVEDTLPSGLEYVSDDDNCNVVNKFITCSFPDLASGDDITFHITAKATNTGTQTNTVEVTTDTHELDPSDNTAHADVLVNPTVDLKMTKTGPATVQADGTITWTLTVANLGPDTATSVEVTDTLPSGVTYVSDDSNCMNASNSLTCPVSNLANGGSATFHIVGQVHPSVANSTISNTAAVTSSEHDSDPNNNHDTATTDVLPAVNLAVIKTADPATVNNGQHVSFTMMVTNAGPDTANNVQLVDTLPSQFTYVSDDGGTDCNNNSGVITCDVGTLTNGQSHTYHIVAAANSVGTWTNNVQVSTSTHELDPADNHASVDVQVNPTADLQMTKTGPASVDADGTITWTLVVHNNGPNTAVNPVVTDPLPNGVTYVSDDSSCGHPAGVLTCNLADIASGDSQTIHFVGQVHSTLAETVISNTARVDSPTYDNDPANNEDTFDTDVLPAVDLQTTKTVNPDTVNNGQNTTFTITVANNGPSTAANVQLVDTLPAQLTYVSDDGGTDCNNNSGVITCDVGTLTNGQSKSYHIVATATSTGTWTNNVQASTTTHELDNSNDHASADVLVHPTADLKMTKTGPANVEADGTITWTLVVHNNGPDTAVNPVVTDTLPSGVTYVSDDSSCGHPAGVLTCNLADIASGDSQTIHFVGQLDPSLAGTTLSNTARVDSPTYDDEPANNEDTFDTDVLPAVDLNITKAANIPSVNQGGKVTFEIVVTNNGPSTAQNVVVTDTLPNELSYVSNDSGCTKLLQVVTCNLGDMSNGSSQTIHLVAKGLTIGDPVTNNVVVTTDTHELDNSNNEAQASINVGPTADLELVKTAPANVAAGDDVPYSLQVTNHGPSTAHHVIVTDVLPAGTDFVDASPGCTENNGTVTCDVGDIANGDNTVVHITVHTTDAVAGTTIVNNASAAGDEYNSDPDQAEDSASTDVAPLSDIVVQKTGAASMQAGTRVHWDIVVTNTGPNAAQSVHLTDTVPNNLGNVQLTTDSGTCSNDGTCDLGTVGVGEIIHIGISGDLPRSATGTITNTATATTSTPESSTSNNTSSVTSTVTDPVPLVPNLSITKTLMTANPQLGKQLTYHIAVSNSGTADAHNVIVYDSLTANTSYVQATVDNGGTCKYKSPTVTCTIPTIGIGQTATITLVVKAIAPGDFKNTATFTADGASPPDNSASAAAIISDPQTNLSIKKAANRKTVPVGRTVRYSITVKNTTSRAAANVRVCDTIPAHTTVVAVGGGKLSRGKVCWKRALLAGHATKHYGLILRVDREAPLGKLVNTAKVQAKNAKSRSASASVLKRPGAHGRHGGVTG